MPENAPHADEPLDVPPDDPGAYDAPGELDATERDTDARGDLLPPRSALRLAAVAAVVLAVGAALLVYRAHHRARVVAEGLAKADALLALDTAAGYRAAASLLEPVAALDPVHAASVRAFALAMLFADYRDEGAEAEAEGLLVAPSREEVVPSRAHLAAAALALGRREAGTALGAAARAGDGAWARTLQARVAFLARSLEAAVEPAAAAAATGELAAAHALHGDVLRRLRRDPAGARAAYEAALAASPLQPRAAYGLAKLALGRQAPAGGAVAALERLAADPETLAPERARAALHLAALRLREGDRAGAAAALERAGLDPRARGWATRAAAVAAAARGPYRAVAGAPPALRSASDDDPGLLPPTAPPAPRKTAAPAKRAAPRKAAPSRKAAPRGAAATRAR